MPLQPGKSRQLGQLKEIIIYSVCKFCSTVFSFFKCIFNKTKGIYVFLMHYLSKIIV